MGLAMGKAVLNRRLPGFLVAAADTTGISGLRGSGNFREATTKEEPDSLW